MTTPEFRKQVFELNRSANNGTAYCVNCGKEKIFKPSQLVADHINNNNKDNRIENGQVLCRSCNKKKDPSKISKMLKVKGLTLNLIYTEAQKSILQDKLRIDSLPMVKNIYGKPVFEQYVITLLIQKYQLNKRDVVLAGANVAGVSKMCGENWLDLMCSLTGDCEEYTHEGKAWVRLKPASRDKLLNDVKNKYTK